MMKVLLLNGSANKNGNTFTALSEIAKQLKKNGVESEIMQMGNKPVRGCIACGQCQAKQLGHLRPMRSSSARPSITGSPTEQ